MFFKKLHTLTLKSFIPPFFVTLFVSVFLFFLVKVVITYLDDFLGKGLRTIDLVQLFVYAWIAIVPQCIPLAVLLGSIMSFGNLAENYELAAMKSSGLSLFRIIKPVVVFIVILAGLVFLFNNFILPVMELKSQSLLWDIRQTKPTVAIKEGIFYNKIENYALRVGAKSKNKDTLKEIYIYDHSSHQGNTIQMYAQSGKLKNTADTSALVLILRNGNRYEEVVDHQHPKKKSMSQLNFKQLQVNIPLEDFKLKRTDEKAFKDHGEMLNIWQIDSVHDSISRRLVRRINELRAQSTNYFFGRTAAAMRIKGKYKPQSIKLFYDSLKKDEYSRAVENAMGIIRSNTGIVEVSGNHIIGDEDNLIQFETEWHKKIVVCFACIILFFVGAPLGAIIKKGGLGLPVVVAVFFFLAYFILTEAFTTLAFDGTLPPWQAVWAPLVIFLPISIFLTYKAAKDSAIFDVTVYYMWAVKLFKRKKIAENTANSQ
ncbi:MAG: permease YjgP/YjgQ family protein [Bacteroidetes bacterium]|nr:permease YjgP/YjgQ family protein [Bacteroidota bacterium]